MTTDQLERLFADLRAEALPEVEAPGAAAARHTVRRRRITRSSAAGAAAVAVVAGLAVGLPRLTAHEPSIPAAAWPVDTTALTTWGEAAAEAVALDSFDPTLGAVLKDSGPGAMLSTQYVIRGTYLTKLVCYGLGSVTVTMDVSSTGHPEVTRTATLPCNRTVTSLNLPVAGAEGTVAIQVVPDAQAARGTAVAYRMELSQQDQSRLQAQAWEALGPRDGENQVFAMAGALTDSSYGSRDDNMGAGRYRALVTCVGAGTVTMSVELALKEGIDKTKPIHRADLRCGPEVSSRYVTFTVPAKPKGVVDVDLTADERGRGQVAAAIRVERA